MNFINNEPIVLASQSPRRKELLAQAGIEFKIKVSDIDESTVAHAVPEKYVQHLAVLKAKDVGKSYPDTWTIGADTIVTYNKKILGKPKTKNDAIYMLKQLSDRAHYVYTGFCLYHHSQNKMFQKSVLTTVIFKPLTEREINWYVDTNEPFDKAGGYGIQGMGAFMVKKIKGSYTNVVGLPVCEVIQALNKINLIKL